MTSVEERIKQEGKTVFDRVMPEVLPEKECFYTKAEEKFWEGFQEGFGECFAKCEMAKDKFIDEKVLQILKEQKVKWCELLKLWKTRPFTDFVPLDNLSSECKECINNVLEWYKKIEEKLKEVKHPK